MKNTKIKIIVSFIALLSFAGSTHIVQAAVASVYVSPASLTKSVGDSFTASVVLSPAGNTVYAVEGTVVFSGVSCKSITLAEGVMAQTTPTCASPGFVLGLASGATASKTLFTVSLNAPSAGTATVGIARADIVGAGVSISNTSLGGTYTINALPVVVPKPIEVIVKLVEKLVEKTSVKKVVDPVSTSSAVTSEPVVVPEVVPEVVAETAPVEETKNNNTQAQVISASPGLSGTWIITLGLMLVSFFAGYIFRQIFPTNFRQNKK